MRITFYTTEQGVHFPIAAARGHRLQDDLNTLKGYAPFALQPWDKVVYAKHGSAVRDGVKVWYDVEGHFYSLQQVKAPVEAIRTGAGKHILVSICNRVNNIAFHIYIGT